MPFQLSASDCTYNNTTITTNDTKNNNKNSNKNCNKYNRKRIVSSMNFATLVEVAFEKNNTMSKDAGRPLVKSLHQHNLWRKLQQSFLQNNDRGSLALQQVLSEEELTVERVFARVVQHNNEKRRHTFPLSFHQHQHQHNNNNSLLLHHSSFPFCDEAFDSNYSSLESDVNGDSDVDEAKEVSVRHDSGVSLASQLNDAMMDEGHDVQQQKQQKKFSVVIDNRQSKARRKGFKSSMRPFAFHSSSSLTSSSLSSSSSSSSSSSLSFSSSLPPPKGKSYQDGRTQRCSIAKSKSSCSFSRSYDHASCSAMFINKQRQHQQQHKGHLEKRSIPPSSSSSISL
eukprot:m.6401 g.6401  ORF g.6401 m.6401 type:complete len:340 (-) comp2590_c0_seq1:456-1475(-)